MMLTALMLDVISFNPMFVYNIAGFIALVIGLVGSFFKQQNAINVLKNEIQNMKENNIKLEDRVNNSESKIQAQISILEERMDHRLSQVYDKIEKLPSDLSILFKNIMAK